MLRKLPYVCPNNVFVIPIAHAMMYGVVRDMARYMFEEGGRKNGKYVFSKRQKNLVSKRA